jgi:secreted trypsin-like serine protease
MPTTFFSAATVRGLQALMEKQRLICLTWLESVGVRTADSTLYPFYAYFEILKTESGQQGNYICGGSLIAPDIVLSAGHCFYGDVQNVAVIVNNTNFSEFTGYEYARQVVSFKVHPDYIHETYTNDICIVVLSSPVAEVTPVALNTERSTPPDGADVQVIGMGFTKESRPRRRFQTLS